MMFTFILLILPLLVLARLNIYLTGQFEGSRSDLELNFDGEDIAPLSDIEINTFSLSEENLKYAVEMCMYKRPESVYLRVPVSIRDYYMKNGYHDGARIIRIQRGQILNISKTVISFEKYSQKPINSTINIFQELFNTATTSWNTQGEISPSNNTIGYNVNITVPKDRVSMSLFFTSLWGERTKLSQIVSFHALSPIDFVYNAAQSVIVQFQVTKHSIQIEMEYKSLLAGDITSFFPDMYNGSYYRAVPLYACMVTAGLPYKILSREVVDMEFYINPKIIVYNMSNYAKIMELNFRG